MMKNINALMKIISALAAVVGAVYIIAVYGDRIVAWAKQLMGCNPQPVTTLHFTSTEPSNEPQAAPAEKPAEPAPAPEAPAESAAAPAPEAPAAEAPAAEDSIPVADEEDFEG